MWVKKENIAELKGFTTQAVKNCQGKATIGILRGYLDINCTVLHLLDTKLQQIFIFSGIVVLQWEVQESNCVVVQRKQKSCIIEIPQMLCAWMKFPLWPLSTGLPIMRSANGGAISRSYAGADS